MVRRPRNNALDGRLTDRQLDLVVRQIDSLPIAPPVGRAMLGAILADGAADPLLGLARLDVYACAWLLAQSEAPVAYERLRAVVLSSNLGQLLDGGLCPLDLTQFWRHCLAVAVATREIAAHLGLPIDPAEAFACGLLHDLGKLALAACLPKSYARVLAADPARTGNVADAEQALLGVDHTIFGRRLAQHWRLPARVESVIWLHHQDPEAIPESLPDRRLVAAVGLGDAVSRHLGIGFSGNHSRPRPLEAWARQIGCQGGFTAGLCRDLPERLREAIEPVEMASPARPAPTSAAIAQCLTRQGRDLAAQNEQLAPKAAAMDILGGFLEGLSTQTTVAEALAQVATGIARALASEPSPAQPIVAYCLDAAEDPGTALLCRCDGPDSFAWRTVHCAAGAKTDAPSNSATVAEHLAGADELGDWFDPSACAHLELRSGRQWIGGVFVPEPARVPPSSGFLSAWGCQPAADGRHATALSGLLGAMGMALGVVQGQARAWRLNEDLSQASRVLADASQALSEAQNVRLIGQMAAGAAHELNNPLAIISGRAQLMGSRAKTPEEKKVWTTITEQAQRISDILTDLMSIASPPAPQRQPVEARALLERAAQAFVASRGNSGPGPKVEIHVEEGLRLAVVDAAQMESVIAELITNAVTAGGPEVSVCLSADDDGGGMLLLTVADDGPGMDERTLEQAFTPFFSDQPAGRRRGLGLARVRRWVEINGGSVRLTSRPAAGTQIQLTLPTE